MNGETCVVSPFVYGFSKRERAMLFSVHLLQVLDAQRAALGEALQEKVKRTPNAHVRCFLCNDAAGCYQRPWEMKQRGKNGSLLVACLMAHTPLRLAHCASLVAK